MESDTNHWDSCVHISLWNKDCILHILMFLWWGYNYQVQEMVWLQQKIYFHRSEAIGENEGIGIADSSECYKEKSISDLLLVYKHFSLCVYTLSYAYTCICV